MEKLSVVWLACIAAFSCIPTCSASPEDPRRPLGERIGARDGWNVSFPLTQVPPPDPSSTTSTCQTYEPCNLFYQYVSIFYWPTESQNTACLTSLASPTASSIDLGFPTVSPSIYAIFPSIIASDGCKQIGATYGPITTSFAPGELSTIEPGSHSTKVFNFADLPCPPPGIDVPPGETYAPLISPPSFIFDLDPAFSRCIPGYSQGVDPPTANPTITGGLHGPGAAGMGHHPRNLGAYGHPHVTPGAPKKTAEPTHNGRLY